MSEQRESTRKMMKQMTKKITHKMESTGMFCTSWRIHLYSGLEVWGDLSDVRKSRAFGIKMNSDLKQILFRLLVCQGGLLDPLGPCLIRARVTIFALGLSLPKNDVQILANC